MNTAASASIQKQADKAFDESLTPEAYQAIKGFGYRGGKNFFKKVLYIFNCR